MTELPRNIGFPRFGDVAHLGHVLGLRLTEQIVFDDGSEVGAWLAATNKSYDMAITHDRRWDAARDRGSAQRD
jgi:hypothetical protein